MRLGRIKNPRADLRAPSRSFLSRSTQNFYRSSSLGVAIKMQNMIGKTISHYRIIEKLGEGGMGVIFKAEDTKLKRFVALKFLPSALTLDKEARDRFIYEAQAASGLDHPNICTIYEIDETAEGQMFIAMAYYEGETLQKKVASNQLAVNSAIDIAIQIAQGLAKAHQHGIVHRDIKPSNIIVTNEGVGKILDFGLAKLSGVTRLTKTGSTMGTVAYMSPEQTWGEEVDQRTDLWSLGAVLYEMLTGKLPFRGEYEQAIIYSILHEAPEPISHLRPEASADFEYVIAKALTKDANKRYAFATELLQDLENLKAGKALTPAPVAVAVATTVTTENTIAVLEFTNITGNPADDWLSGGMAETLTVDLKKISTLKVISRETVARTLARFAQQKPSEERNLGLGRELKARWVIWGGYQKLGLTIRITAHFAEVATGSLIGAAKVDGMMEDIFKLQDQLITSLMETLNLAVTSAELQKIERPETFELKAYEYHARGRQMLIQFNPASLQEAQKFFEKAIAVDPSYGLAYSGLGSAHIFQFIAQTDPQDLELGITYLQKALQYDPDLAEPYTWLTYALVRKQQFAEAIQTGLRAVELEENNFSSFYFLAVAYGGQADKGNLPDGYTHAAKYFKKAVVLQPNFQWSCMMLGFVYMLNGQPHEAQRYLDKAVELEDSGKSVGIKAVGALTLRGNLALRQQQLDLAQDLYQRSLLRLEGVQHVYREYLMALSYCGLGQIHFNRRNYDKAVEAFQKALEVIKSRPQALSLGFLLVKANLGLAKAHYQFMMTREAKAHFEAAQPFLPRSRDLISATRGKEPRRRCIMTLPAIMP